MAAVLHSAPRITSNEGVKAALSAALGAMLVEAREEHGEILLTVARDSIEDALRLLRAFDPSVSTPCCHLPVPGRI